MNLERKEGCAKDLVGIMAELQRGGSLGTMLGLATFLMLTGHPLIAGGLEPAAALQASVVSEFIPIQYTLASDVAEVLRLVATNSVKGPGTPSQGGSTNNLASSALEGRAAIVARKMAEREDLQLYGPLTVASDERSNSLLISARPTELATIRKIIAQCDRVLSQVLIEALVVQVPLAEVRPSNGSIPVELQALGSDLAFQVREVGPTVNKKSGAPDEVNYVARLGVSLDAAMSLLSTNCRILQHPRIQTSEGVAATLFVGERRDYPKEAYLSGGATCGCGSQYRLEIGTSTSVTPRLTADGFILLDIQQEVDRLAGMVTIQNVGDVPVTTSSKSQAQVTVPDRGTIVLGGIIENNTTPIFPEVSSLKSIPWVGGTLNWLVRLPKHSSRTELVLLIQPSILPVPELAELRPRERSEKMPGIRSTEVEIRAEETKRARLH